MLLDPLRLAVAFIPLVAYCLVIGLLNARRRPFLTTGGADLAALGVALTGLVLIGPIELFRPERATAEFGNYVLLLMLVLYWLSLWLTIMLGRPRLVIYNISGEELRPILSETARAIDADARWAGDSLSLPTLGAQLHVETFDIMRHVTLIASGDKQKLSGWRALAGELNQRLSPLRVDSNPRALGLVLLATVLLTVTLVQLINNPQLVAQAIRRDVFLLRARLAELSFRWLFEHAKLNPKRQIALLDLLGIELVQLCQQRFGRLESIRYSIRIGQVFQGHLLHVLDADIADPWDVAPLAGAHHPPTPKSDRLCLFTSTNRGEELLLEQQHPWDSLHGGWPGIPQAMDRDLRSPILSGPLPRRPSSNAKPDCQHYVTDAQGLAGG